MSEPFPPSLGARIAGRFDLLAPLRGEGPARAFLVQDRQTGKRTGLTLFDPARVTAGAWAEYVRISKAAAGVQGLAVPAEVASEPPSPPHVIEEPPAHRALDRLLVQERRLPWLRAVTIAERVAGALQAALAATQVGHRALTPYRITVDPRDEVQVHDFGVAVFDLPGDPPEEPNYRAPEQSEGHGEAADIYSLALIVHGLVSGAAPTDVPPARLGSLASVPAELEALLEKALTRDPAQRPDLMSLRAGMRELLRLPALSTSEPPAPASPEPPAPIAEPEPVAATPLPVVSTPLPVVSTPYRAPAARKIPETPRPVVGSVERTDVLSSHIVAPETTLIISAHVEPPTEQIQLPSLSRARPRTPISTPVPVPFEPPTEELRLAPFGRPFVPAAPARAPADDDERTSVYVAPPRGAVPSAERTEFVPASHISAASNERTEVLQSSTPARAPAESSERTELVHSPAYTTPSQRAPARPAPAVDPDDARTLDRPFMIIPTPTRAASTAAASRPRPAPACGSQAPPVRPVVSLQPAALRVLLICSVCLTIAMLIAIVLLITS